VRETKSESGCGADWFDQRTGIDADGAGVESGGSGRHENGAEDVARISEPEEVTEIGTMADARDAESDAIPEAMSSAVSPASTT
jgi:hypothetical protein